MNDEREKMNEVVEEHKEKNNSLKIIYILLIIILLCTCLYFMNDKYGWLKIGNKKQNDNKAEEKTESKNNEETKKIEEEKTESKNNEETKKIEEEKISFYRKYNDNNEGKIYIEKNDKKEFFMNEPKNSENGIDYLYNDGKLYYYYMIDDTDSPYILNYIDVETKKIYKNVATLKVDKLNNNNVESYSGIIIYAIKNNYIYYGYNLVQNNSYGHTEVVAKYSLNTKKSKILMNVKNIDFIKGGGGFFAPTAQYFFDKLYVFIGKENTKDRALYTIDKNDKIELIDNSTGVVAGYHAGSSYITKIGNKLYYYDVNAKEYNSKTNKIKALFNIEKDEYLSAGKTGYYKNGLIALSSKNKLYYYDGNKSQTFTIKLSNGVQKTLCYDLDDNGKKTYRDCEKDELDNYAWAIKIKDDYIYIVLYPTYDEAKISIKNLKGNEITLINDDIIHHNEDSDSNNDYELIA